MLPRTLVTGAAGNLGGLLARHLAEAGYPLRLMEHRTPVDEALRAAPGVEVVRADLSDPATLPVALAGVEVVVHFAGVLFKARPERFLPTTNTRWFASLLAACAAAGVRRVILVSFPHVEGPSDRQSPATGRLDGAPSSVHARTRLAEERRLLLGTPSVPEPVVLRLGMVYGRGVLMPDAARWLARHRLLGIWRCPTPIQLLSVPDMLAAMQAAVERPEIRGIYHLGDEHPVTLQDFLDRATALWGCPRPWRMPFAWIRAAALLCEIGSLLLGTRAWLTRDFVTIGREPYWGDTARMRRELLPVLRHPSLEDGIETLR